jgi:hypothetical protein
VSAPRRAPDPLDPACRTDYRALEANRSTLGSWDLQYTSGPRAGQYFEPVVEIVAVERYKAPSHIRTKGNELLLTLKGKHGVLPKRWIVRPDTKRSIAKSGAGYIVQGWIGKSIQIYYDPTIKFGREVTGGLRARRPPGSAPLTEEPLDMPVDDAKAAQIDAAVAACFGEDDES